MRSSTAALSSNSATHRPPSGGGGVGSAQRQAVEEDREIPRVDPEKKRDTIKGNGNVDKQRSQFDTPTSVPNSVRYLVWAHLTNSKAKEMPKVYHQLLCRGRVPAFSDTESDIHRFFPSPDATSNGGRASTFPFESIPYDGAGPQIQTGTILLLSSTDASILNAAFCVGLTCVAGHLLLLSPEEDASWIFVSVVDAHLRPHFSVNSIQMDIDASLFGRAMESSDAPVTKKLFVDMGIGPASICQ
jgi:hypothetical protein